MTSTLMALVVDDSEIWGTELADILGRLGTDSIPIHVDHATNCEAALQLIDQKPYDLTIVDLELPETATANLKTPEVGWHLLEILHDRIADFAVAVIVLTANATTSRTTTALKKIGVHNFISKLDFERNAFVLAARRAILSVRLAKSNSRHKSRYFVDISYADGVWLGSDLSGPNP